MSKTKVLERKVDPMWMVLSRHFSMSGGVLDYGIGNIEEFFNNFEEADQYAKKHFLSNIKNQFGLTVWVLKCEKTYQKAKEGFACAISKGAD